MFEVVFWTYFFKTIVPIIFHQTVVVILKLEKG